jgi:hypothetical protein
MEVGAKQASATGYAIYCCTSRMGLLERCVERTANMNNIK